MGFLHSILGEGQQLTILQMSCRGVLIFIITFVLIRVSGRRSFGLRTPIDNIIAILLGAILSRAVVGASPFLAVVVTCFVIVLLHRACSIIVIRHRKIGKWTMNDHILLFDNGRFIQKNLEKALAREEDAMQGVRKSGLTDNLDEIDKIYMESNGEISVIKKPAKH